MAEFNQNLWAPWRMDFIRSLGEDLTDEACFLCRYWQSPDCDTTNHVVWRDESAMVVMNRFPYTNGHLMIAPASHKGDLQELTDVELAHLAHVTRDAVQVLSQSIQPQGFNVGYNIGRCAGAGLPGHLHAHIVPRWSGDTNFMAVIDSARVIPDALGTLHRQLRRTAEALGLIV